MYEYFFELFCKNEHIVILRVPIISIIVAFQKFKKEEPKNEGT